jgi:hypothetical protein
MCEPTWVHRFSDFDSIAVKREDAGSSKKDETMKPIWIVDDDHSIRFVLERALQRQRGVGGFECGIA